MNPTKQLSMMAILAILIVACESRCKVELIANQATPKVVYECKGENPIGVRSKEYSGKTETFRDVSADDDDIGWDNNDDDDYYRMELTGDFQYNRVEVLDKVDWKNCEGGNPNTCGASACKYRSFSKNHHKFIAEWVAGDEITEQRCIFKCGSGLHGVGQPFDISAVPICLV